MLFLRVNSRSLTASRKKLLSHRKAHWKTKESLWPFTIHLRLFVVLSSQTQIRIPRALRFTPIGVGICAPSKGDTLQNLFWGRESRGCWSFKAEKKGKQYEIFTTVRTRNVSSTIQRDARILTMSDYFEDNHWQLVAVTSCARLPWSHVQIWRWKERSKVHDEKRSLEREHEKISSNQCIIMFSYCLVTSLLWYCGEEVLLGKDTIGTKIQLALEMEK